MEYDSRYGIYKFNGSEDDLAFHYMWTLLTDLSWRGKVEVIWRVLFVKPPKRYWEIEHEFKRQQHVY